MTNKELYFFIGQCVALDDNTENYNAVVSAFTNNLVPIEKFVFMASGHLILPLIYIQFRNADILSHLPEELSEHLEMIYNLNASRNNQILREVSDVALLLSENNIECLFLKGSGNILDNLYNDIGARILGDIDILVSDKDFETAANLLSDVGYIYEGKYHRNEKSTLKHFPRMSKAGCVADLEIHRIPVEVKYADKFSTELVFSTKKAIANEIRTFVNSDRNKTIHNFVHGQLGDKGSYFANVSFRNIYDIYLLSKRINVEEALITANIERKKAIAYLKFASEALNLSDPLTHIKSKYADCYSFRVKMNLSSKLLNRILYVVLYINYRIYEGYVVKVLRIPFDRTVRQSVVRRLSDKNWYASHIRSYKDLFRR